MILPPLVFPAWKHAADWRQKLADGALAERETLTTINVLFSEQSYKVRRRDSQDDDT